MSQRSVIIIGAGLAGLSAGIFAQLNGYQSHIFEHHFRPGGVAAAWKRHEYVIDGGIHFVMGHKRGSGLYELYRQLGIVPACRMLGLDIYGRFVDEASGRSVAITGDLEQLEEDLKTLSPADGGVVDGLIAGVRGMRGIDLTAVGMGTPPELERPWNRLKELWAMRPLLKYVTGPFSRPVSEYAGGVQDPALRACLESLFLPQVPVFFVQMLLALLARGELGLIERGCRDFVGVMEAHYRALRGRVSYGSTVEEILVRDSRAEGVRLADGSEHRADAVIAACDGYSTVFKMLGGRFTTEKIRTRYATWPTFAPLLMISYGVAREFPGEPVFSTLRLAEPLTVGRQMVKAIFVRVFNYSPYFAPPGKTVVQAEVETEWAYWNDLQREDRAAYDAEKERLAAQVLSRLEPHYPGLSAAVEVTDVSTPYTTWRYTLNHQGAWEGWLMTAEIMNERFERTLPSLSRFVMAGQWVTPGGGVPAVLYTGRDAVRLLCKQDGRPFVTERS